MLGCYYQTSNHNEKDMDDGQQKVKLKELSLVRVMNRDNAELQNYINQSKGQSCNQKIKQHIKLSLCLYTISIQLSLTYITVLTIISNRAQAAIASVRKTSLAGCIILTKIAFTEILCDKDPKED